MKTYRFFCALLLAGACSLSAVEPSSLQFEVSSITFIPNMRTGERSAKISLHVSGIDPARIRAARVMVTKALDQDGGELQQRGSGAFSIVAVGPSFGGNNSEVTSRRSDISFELLIAKSVTSVREVVGEVELFIPDLDPAATFVVANVAAHLGAVLRASGSQEPAITLAVFDQALSERHRANPIKGEGPAEYEGGPMFGHAFDEQEARIAASSPVMAQQLAKMREIHEADLVVGIEDPENRIVNVEFQTATGGALRYNHNGNYHSSGLAGRRLDIYDLRTPIAPNARMVCWLTTAKSVLRMPLKLEKIVLPPVTRPR